jgi:hypothetical protein
MSAIRPSFFSAAEWSPPQAYRLSLSTFWSDYSHWKYERRRLENGGHSLSEAWTGIIGCWYGGHRNRRRPLYVLCIKFKYLGSYFVPELNDTADITERISQARKLFGSMNKQLLGNKIYRSISVAGSIKRLLWI